jgi:hypothetical protein
MARVKVNSGDSVTQGGSSFVALQTTSGERPGEGSAAWRMHTKRGRDARDRTEPKEPTLR